MTFTKKSVKKIEKATKEELGKLQQEYEAVAGSFRGMNPAGLLFIAAVGIAIILSSQSNLLDLVGLVMLLYPLYIFIRRGAHREGYLEGFYEMMARVDTKAQHTPSDQ